MFLDSLCHTKTQHMKSLKSRILLSVPGPNPYPSPSFPHTRPPLSLPVCPLIRDYGLCLFCLLYISYYCCHEFEIWLNSFDQMILPCNKYVYIHMYRKREICVTVAFGSFTPYCRSKQEVGWNCCSGCLSSSLLKFSPCLHYVELPRSCHDLSHYLSFFPFFFSPTSRFIIWFLFCFCFLIKERGIN